MQRIRETTRCGCLDLRIATQRSVGTKNTNTQALGGALRCRLRHLATRPIYVSFQRIHSREALLTVLAHMRHRHVLAFIVALQILWKRERGTTYVTRVGGGGSRRGWGRMSGRGRRRTHPSGGVQILSVATPCLHRRVRIRVLRSNKLCPILRWDNRLSIFDRAVALEVGRNSGVQRCPRPMRTGRIVLRVLGIHELPCLLRGKARQARGVTSDYKYSQS